MMYDEQPFDDRHAPQGEDRERAAAAESAAWLEQNRTYSLSGEPAASRIERYLDALSAYDQHTIYDRRGGIGPVLLNNNRLLEQDLRAVLAELHDYQTGVKAVLAMPGVKARNTYAHGYDAAQTDVRRTLAQHIPDVLDEKP